MLYSIITDSDCCKVAKYRLCITKVKKMTKQIIEENLRKRTTEDLKKDIIVAMKSEEENSIIIFSLGLGILDQVKVRALKQGVTLIRLDCVAHNLKLRNYYESYGFTCVQERNNGVVELALYELKL